MAATLDVPEGVKIDRDADEKNKIIRRAYSEIGGIPKNHVKTNACRVGTAWRVNIYVEVPSENFVKSSKIEHSFYYKD